jgi:hypothetical protein
MKRYNMEPLIVVNALTLIWVMLGGPKLTLMWLGVLAVNDVIAWAIWRNGKCVTGFWRLGVCLSPVVSLVLFCLVLRWTNLGTGLS